MDNAAIHTPAKLRDLTEIKGYRCLYLPPYPPFIKPIKEFWPNLKAGMSRNALAATDRLSERICESARIWLELTAKHE